MEFRILGPLELEQNGRSLACKSAKQRLLLATLLRRTGQLTEASNQLRRLEATDGAEKWRSEIDRERKLLDELFHPQTEADESENQISKDNQLTDNQSTDETTAENQAA